MFLTQEELHELTGYQIPKCQMRVLRENGIKFIIGRDGKPKVLTSAVEENYGLKSNKEKKTVPNYKAFEQWIENGA